MVIFEILVEVIAVPAKHKNVSAFAILVGSCVADDYASLVVWIEKEARTQGERLCPRKLRKIIIVNIVFFLIVDGAEKRVTELLKLSRIEDRKVRSECGSLIKDDRGNWSIFGFLADEIDYAGNCTTAVKSCGRPFDYLHLF